jgi:hypothetical protein
VTLASLLGVKSPHRGSVMGRASEALTSGSRDVTATSSMMRSEPSSNGNRTILLYQRVGPQRYLDEACYALDSCAAARSASLSRSSP